MSTTTEALPELPFRVRLGIALASASATIALVYAVIRVVQAIFYPEGDPALVVWSPRAAMFWRFWVGVYIGGGIGLGAYALAGRSPLQAARWNYVLVWVSVLAITIQGIFVP